MAVQPADTPERNVELYLWRLQKFHGFRELADQATAPLHEFLDGLVKALRSQGELPSLRVADDLEKSQDGSLLSRIWSLTAEAVLAYQEAKELWRHIPAEVQILLVSPESALGIIPSRRKKSQ